MALEEQPVRPTASCRATHFGQHCPFSLSLCGGWCESVRRAAHLVCCEGCLCSLLCGCPCCRLVCLCKACGCSGVASAGCMNGFWCLVACTRLHLFDLGEVAGAAGPGPSVKRGGLAPLVFAVAGCRRTRAWPLLSGVVPHGVLARVLSSRAGGPRLRRSQGAATARGPFWQKSGQPRRCAVRAKQFVCMLVAVWGMRSALIVIPQPA